MPNARSSPACSGVGYRGRTGIYELIVVDPEIKGLVVQRVESGVISRKAMEKGMETLRDDGAHKVLEGITTIAARETGRSGVRRHSGVTWNAPRGVDRTSPTPEAGKPTD